MKNTSLIFKFLVVFLFGLQPVFGQIISLDYQLRYDNIDEEYDCYIIINSGSAITIPQRIQSSSQYSIVTPSNIEISISNNYMPLKNNGSYNGTIPCMWGIIDVIESPLAQEESNFYSISPQPGNFLYNDLSSGDSIKLFSFITIGTGTSCTDQIRIYINGVDPSASDPGMELSDYSNGFTIGSPLQLYNENLPAVNIPSLTPIVDIIGNNQICINNTTQLDPNSGGVWTSSDPTIAIVDNTGFVVGISEGMVNFVFTDDITGCYSDPTGYVIVQPLLNIEYTGGDQVCIGSTTTISPTTGGVWISNNPGVASITNSGLITGLAPGIVTFTFTNEDGSCTGTSGTLIVDIAPSTSISNDNICIGLTTTATPNNGSWTSSDSTIASITNEGLITSISAGTVDFTFLDPFTGCSSNPTTLIVVPNPEVGITGDTIICQNWTTQLSPNNGGVWISLNPSLATVTNTGLVTGWQVGIVRFEFTSLTTLCTSDPTYPITISANPIVEIANDEIFIGETTILSPTTGGNWTSSDSIVATVNDQGVVTGISQGEATFSFLHMNGCMAITSEIYVIDSICITPHAFANSISSNNATDGSVTCNPTGGVTPYTFLWSNGETTQSIENLASGTYSVIVNGAEGCYGNDTVIVAYCPLIVADISTENTSCFAVCDGIITVNNVTGGVAPYEYIWNTAQKTAQINGQCAGTYALTITDAIGCMMDTSDFIINQPPLLLVNAEADNTSAIAIPSGGTPPYTYTWSNGETTHNIFNIPAGYYSITVTDTNGCQAVETVITDILFSIDSIFHITDNYLGAIYLSTNSETTVYNWTGPEGYTSQEEDIINLETAGCYYVNINDTLNQITKDTTICINDLSKVNNLFVPNDGITIYPNPTSDNLFIRTINKINVLGVTIYDISGKQKNLPISDINSETIIISMNDVEKGVYVLKIKHTRGINYKKVIVVE